MEFIANNWIWFLVGGIVILMTVIGYFAEKTDFGRKGKEPQERKPKPEKIKKEKPAKEEKSSAEILDEKLKQPEVQMALATDAILDNTQEDTETLQFDMPNPEIQEYEAKEDLNVPFGDNTTFETTYSEPVIYSEPEEKPSVETTTKEDYLDFDHFTAPKVEEVIAEEPIETKEEPEIFNPHIELPDLDSLVNSSTTNDSGEDDDVWKF